MSLRIRAARFFLGLSSLIESLAITIMRPDDLVAFSRQSYARSHNVANWSSPEFVQTGLTDEEQILLNKLPLRQGRLLLLDLGGGREAISLAKAGFSVTGVDFIPGMIEQAKANAEMAGVRIEAFVQEISHLDVPPETYDVAWLSAGMYSSVPTRRRRIEMLKRIRQALRPGGYFLCQFQCRAPAPSPRRERIKRAFAWLTMGNLTYEPGDLLWSNIEFIHCFQTKEELYAEFTTGGFAVVDLCFHEHGVRGDAILRKD